MLRLVSAWLFSLVVVLPAAAAEPGLAEARRLWLRGRYDEARAAYEALVNAPATRDAAAVGLSRVLASTGRYDEALGSVEAALAQSAGSADLLARRAELLHARGRCEEADREAAKALAVKKDHFLARWVRALVRRDRGDLTSADEGFRWFVRTYTALNDAGDDVKDPDALLLVGLAGLENARWNNLPDQFQMVVNDVFGSALESDKTFWPAEYQAGLVYLEKFNRPEALAALGRALAINPCAADALAAKGALALQAYELGEADALAERALAINPNLVEALALKADVFLTAGEAGRALEQLDRARKVNSADERVLGRVAACFVLARRTGDLEALEREVKARDPRPGVFYATLGDCLERRRLYPEAEAYFRKAADAWPVLTTAPAALGLLDMKMAREADARPLLEKAFEADPFNIRVGNTIAVLDHLARYETLRTPHFELRFDPRTDKLFARFLAPALEATYADLAASYRFAPPDRTLVEVFSTHEMFSGRVTALPDLHTIGACTGRVLAMASPHAKGIGRPFNWAAVVRHELVHIFNLEQTHFQVPHWLTEGLAVENEGFARPPEWGKVLHDRLEAGTLLNLDTIELGFIRPRSADEWALAYCQAQLYADYVRQKFGAEAINRLLAAFGDGLGTREAVARACHVDVAEFERGYREHVRAAVEELRLPPTPKIHTLPELEAAWAKDPNDVGLGARLAEQLFLRHRTEEATGVADAVLAKKPGQSLASYVKARILQAAGAADQARAVLEASVAEDVSEPRVFFLLGKAYFESRDFARAAEMFEQGRKAQPYENEWLAELARTYAQAGDRDRLVGVLKARAAADPDDLAARKQLARALLEAGQFEGAEEWARHALEIDVLDVAAHETLGDAQAGRGRWGESAIAYSDAVGLQPLRDAVRLKLARAYLEAGRHSEAEAEVLKLLARDPDNAEAQKLRGRLRP